MDSSVDEKLLDYNDAQLIHYIKTLPRLPEFRDIILLSSKYLAKAYHGPDMERAVKATEFASALGVRVPRVRRTVSDNGANYCIMDRIQGVALDTEWPKLSWTMSIWLAFQVRRVIRQLRSVESPTAGCLFTGQCTSFYLDDRFGLPSGASLSQVNSFLNFWLNFDSIPHEIKKTPSDHSTCPRPLFSTNDTFVYTHHDLAPRNIMIDSANQLWFIDWDFAGYYPRYFEYAGIHNFSPKGWSRFSIWRWKLFTWIACGFYDKQAHWLETIRDKFTRFPLARRWNMTANGYAAAAGRPFVDS
ncbi:ankyrin repeat protein [Xylaria arbuscula]|nr:ankyrin repeat protein [Xylaria arbuscula]